MKKYVVEFIGTFFLVLTVVLTVNGTAGNMAPLAIGSILMVMIFMILPQQIMPGEWMQIMLQMGRNSILVIIQTLLI